MASDINKNDYLIDHINASIDVKQRILDDKFLLSKIDQVSNLCVDALNLGNKIIFAGNGGSAADAQHIAAEFVSRFRFDRPGLSSISLATDTSILTAIGNDYGFEKIFSRQLQAIGKPGDVFVGITTSGESENIYMAAKQCDIDSITSVGFLGGDGGRVKKEMNISICIPSDQTAFIQESHIMIGHIICGYVEDKIFGKK